MASSIQWYPGHMARARRELEAAREAHDVVIEVLDARMPRASRNPVIAECRGKKPCLVVLSKADLADPAATDAWLAAFRAAASPAVAVTISRGAATRRAVVEGCASLVPGRGAPGKPIRAMACGIPNVGKSSLINVLMERKVADVADRPGVTRAQQKVVTESGMVVSDTPGLMWPKIEDEGSGYRLALAGAIPDAALDLESVALWGARFLMEHCAEGLRARYGLATIPPAPDALLREIGRRRGALRAGGLIDAHKAAEVLIFDLRRGALGRISLERPSFFAGSFSNSG